MTPTETEKTLEDIEADLRFLWRQDTCASLEIWHALEQVKEARHVARKSAESTPDSQ